MPFEPCFNLERMDDRSFRGSVSGLGFLYCDFTRRMSVAGIGARRPSPSPSPTPAPAEATADAAGGAN